MGIASEGRGPADENRICCSCFIPQKRELLPEVLCFVSTICVPYLIVHIEPFRMMIQFFCL